MKDEKGNLIGLPHDYEYRGWKRERNRDLPMLKTDAMWAIIGLLFALAGIIVLIKSPSQIFMVIICFALTGLMAWLIRRQHKKHNELLEKIKKQSLP